MSLAKDKPYYTTPSDYEDDVHAWAFEQAQLLRLGRFSEVDLPNVIEELESLGRETRIQTELAFVDLIAGLLQWQSAPTERTPELSKAIRQARFIIRQEESDNRSLREAASEIVARVYPEATKIAGTATGLSSDDFPRECPFSLEFLRDFDAMPEDPL